jgi:5-methylcytosine-specific restriction endonuclease McrBC GTP-binding regulatory subunit McrB
MFLLDEMNLAHIELYFSDMLSKLEENRNKKSTESAQLDIDLGAGINTLPVKLTRNMFWVGTMNEDETTKGLSDKVVDRSNIITFPRPKQLVSRAFDMVAEGDTLLQRNTWNEWQTAHINLCNDETFHETTHKYKETIQEISEKLEAGGRALGHRVWQSIEHYIAAHPLVIKGIAQKEKPQVDEKYLDAAFAEAVAFKVMPKLRGVETEGKSKKDCLTPIGDIISQKISCLKADYDKALESPYGIFVWKSGEFLTQEIN